MTPNSPNSSEQCSLLFGNIYPEQNRTSPLQGCSCSGVQSRLGVQDLATLWSERAAIREFDGGCVRAIAEVAAFWDCMVEATSRGCEPAAVRYLNVLHDLVHQELDRRLVEVLGAGLEADRVERALIHKRRAEG